MNCSSVWTQLRDWTLPSNSLGLNPLASSPPAILTAAYSSYWDSPGCVLHASVTSTIKATVEPNSVAWLLLNITAPAAISSFLSPFLMLSTTVIPMLISTSLHIPCWSCRHEPSFAYFILNPILLSHAFSGYSLRWLLPTFTPPSMPTCIAMLTKPSTTAKAGALWWKDALSWYLSGTGSRSDIAFRPSHAKKAFG